MEIRLHDNSRLHFDWTTSGALIIEVWKPGMMRDGHGLLLAAMTVLDGEELRTFLHALTPPAIEHE